MNIQEFQENNIIDPNLRRKQNQDTNATGKKKIVTPQEMGFTHEEEKKLNRPEDPILDNMEKAIARKQKEAQLLSNAIEESDGEGISEEEFQDILEQAKYDLEDDNIPTEEEMNNSVDVLPKKPEVKIPSENPTADLMDELDAELEQDEEDYKQYAKENNIAENEYQDAENEEKVLKTYEQPEEPLVEEEKVEEKPVDTINPFKNFVSGDINFDEEDKDLEDNIDDRKLAEKEQKEQMDRLRTLVREKIRPVSKAFDLSSYSVTKRPASNVISLPRANTEKIADWVLMSSQKPIYMKRFSGTEIERLSNGGKGRTRLNQALDTWQLIYNHIVDPHKPESLEEWAKVTSFLDIDHIYMAIYRANFEGSNYIPYTCTNENCKDKVFLSDNFDIMDMCNFETDEDKAMFNEIIGTETSEVNKLYSTEIIPVSENYAFAFREPSIYNIIFESAVLDEEFINKFGDLVSICAYIDEIYYINHQTMELQPVRTNVYQNNMKKTAKSRIINFSKIISILDSDQYNTLIAYINKINESGNKLTYQLPEVTCPTCKTVIEATPTEAQTMVFTRHQLAALATL